MNYTTAPYLTSSKKRDACNTNTIKNKRKMGKNDCDSNKTWEKGVMVIMR
jgi:hypothetical protein